MGRAGGLYRKTARAFSPARPGADLALAFRGDWPRTESGRLGGRRGAGGWLGWRPAAGRPELATPPPAPTQGLSCRGVALAPAGRVSVSSVRGRAGGGRSEPAGPGSLSHLRP